MVLKIFDWGYEVALFQVGAIIGIIIAIFFIIVDYFYLKKQKLTNAKRNIFRLIMVLLIAFLVGGTHYILENVIDVI
ncbi:hypothetical protein ABN763_01925 [Spongiivirga sp. MCCC 1A20706]|uniref:hypothetical protein n=1 Tax=Spongiivirga sp. MCCC 1A20706 TaxID=3160963 RepID=UPI0039776394